MASIVIDETPRCFVYVFINMNMSHSAFLKYLTGDIPSHHSVIASQITSQIAITSFKDTSEAFVFVIRPTCCLIFIIGNHLRQARRRVVTDLKSTEVQLTALRKEDKKN